MISSAYHVAAKISSGSPVFVAWLGIAEPVIADIFAREGYDAVVFDGQHGMFDDNAMARGFAAVASLGGRIKLEPWDDQLTLLKPQAEGGTVAEYEKMPFEVAPFLLYLTRQEAVQASSAKAEVVKAQAESDPDHQ